MRFSIVVPFVLAVAASAALAPPAVAYGVATHAWLAQEDANRLAAADPAKYGFLVSDPDARACFMYGAIFPDMRSVAPQAPSLATIKQRMLAAPGGIVEEVLYSTEEVDTAFANFYTHGGAWLNDFVDAARASGDPYKLAFALGNQAHAIMDKHAQVFHIPTYTQRCGCGDIGVEVVQDPTLAGAWYPGVENELFFEGTGDMARPAAILGFIKEAPYRLHSNRTLSYQRAMALRTFYAQEVAAFQTRNGRPVPSQRSILNAAKLFEVALTFYPFFAAQETLADGVRTFAERYVRLAWWATALTSVIQALTASLLNGQDAFDVIGPLVMPTVAGQVGGRSPASEIMFAFGQGGAEEQRIRAKYAGNDEFQRLVGTGMLDKATHAAQDYELAHHLVFDGVTRARASLFTDDVYWPNFSRPVMKAAGIRSLLRASAGAGLGPTGGAVESVAEAPAVHLLFLRYLDGPGGPALSEVALPGSIGRTLRVEVEVFGSDPNAAMARILRLRLRAHTGAGPNDPVVASRTTIVPALAFDPRTYGFAPRPVLAVEWTIADVPGATKIYVELDERRIAATRDESAVDRLFTTELAAVEPLIQGRPHYDRHYAPFSTVLGSLRIRR